jgi:ankyrin repeat protein
MNKMFASCAACLAVIVAVASAQTPPAAVSDQFYAAIRSNDNTQVETLLRNGAAVEVRDRRGGATPLMHAAAFGSIETMRLLLDKGADVNARSTAGATALMWAATDLSKVRLLIDRGADVNAVSESGRTALMLAAMSEGSGPIVRLLLSHGAKAQVVDKEKATTMTAATFGNDSDSITQLVEAGADVNRADALGLTPLMNAATEGNLDVVTLLLRKGADVNAISLPPHFKVKNGTIALGSFTPLVLASSLGPVTVVKTLIDAGADVNAKEARGLTPLMYASATDHGDLEIIKTLVARGADLKATTLEGETATDWARKSGATPVLALLEGAGGKATAPASRPLPEPAATTIRPAVERSVALLEHASGTFFINSACLACHAQSVTDLAVSAARRAGLRVNEVAATQRASGAAAVFGATATRILERFDPPGSPGVGLYALVGLAAAGYPPDRSTDAILFNLLALQRADGKWHEGGGGFIRPPINEGDFTHTALAIRAVTVYGSPAQDREMKERIARAVAWLREATPRTGQDRSFRVLGLSWGHAERSLIEQAARELIALQRVDGGWGQRDEMASDAYATGQTLYALLESGTVTASSEAVRRGTNYLLSTQRADGSWYVRSRAPKFQPYFEGGFPYGPDQWISSMATSWATTALASSIRADSTAALGKP